MIISELDKVDSVPVVYKEAKGASMRVLISPKEGWEGHVMREFELEPGGYTPKHCHPWPHINYIISGKGHLHFEGTDTEITAGSFAYVPANAEHQFKNLGTDKLKFICIVPEEGHK